MLVLCYILMFGMLSWVWKERKVNKLFILICEWMKVVAAKVAFLLLILTILIIGYLESSFIDFSMASVSIRFLFKSNFCWRLILVVAYAFINFSAVLLFRWIKLEKSDEWRWFMKWDQLFGCLHVEFGI